MEVSDAFGVTHIQDGSFLTAPLEDVAPFQIAAHRYVTNQNRPKGEFMAIPLYRATLELFQKWCVLHFPVIDKKPDQFGISGFSIFPRSCSHIQKTP